MVPAAETDGVGMGNPTILDVKDSYNRRARLQPAFIVVLPVGLAILAWSPDGVKRWTVLWTLFVWAGGTALLAQLARDLGKRKEPSLFESWGGKPSTRILRFAACENPVLVTRRHESLQKALPDLRVPTQAEEFSDPKHSDDIYDACVRWLLEKTRDKKKFSLVFEENCNYGFRRNLWGMRAWAILVSAISLLFGIAGLAFHPKSTAVPFVSYGAIGCIACLLFFWLFVCGADWVKLPADAFAERLLACAEVIDGPGKQSAREAQRKVRRQAKQKMEGRRKSDDSGETP